MPLSRLNRITKCIPRHFSSESLKTLYRPFSTYVWPFYFDNVKIKHKIMVGNWKPDPVAGPWIRPWTPHWTPALQRMRSKGGNFQSSRLVNFEPNGFVVTLKNKLINGVLKPQKKMLTEELQGNLVEHGWLTFWCVLIAFRFQPQSYVKLTSEFWWCGWMVSKWNRKCEIYTWRRWGTFPTLKNW